MVSVSSQMNMNNFSASFVPWSTYFVSTQANLPPSFAVKGLFVGTGCSKSSKNCSDERFK